MNLASVSARDSWHSYSERIWKAYTKRVEWRAGPGRNIHDFSLLGTPNQPCAFNWGLVNGTPKNEYCGGTKVCDLC